MRLVIDRHGLAEVKREHSDALFTIRDKNASNSEREKAHAVLALTYERMLEVACRCLRVTP